uniref:Uncharacterized protein n=1 Tax=Anguilla anguilla TaxID=7936 RepID=A0A0E9QIR2_ANGAN
MTGQFFPPFEISVMKIGEKWLSEVQVDHRHTAASLRKAVKPDLSSTGKRRQSQEAYPSPF